MSVEGDNKKSLLAKKEEENKYCVSGYSIALDNKNDSHAIIVDAAKKAKYVMDVGCGAGYIGKNLKLLGAKKVDGIEIDEEARKFAKKIYDKVYDFSIDTYSVANEYVKFLDNNDKYDCIIFADVLEHLTNPGQTLADFSKKLTKNGKILVSIPNIANMTVIMGLIDQKFNYTKTGILDSTHLRFFTENSFYDFLDNVNEAYGLKLRAKKIAHTLLRDESADDVLFNKLYGDEIYIFQNIFEIVQTDNPRQPRKKRNNYQKLVDYVAKLEKEYRDTATELQKRDKIIADLQNSTSWKITAPLRKVSKATKKGVV